MAGFRSRVGKSLSLCRLVIVRGGDVKIRSKIILTRSSAIAERPRCSLFKL